MASEEAYSDIIREAIERAGGLSALSRLLSPVVGKTIWASHLSNLRDGLTANDVRVTKALESIYPDLAVRLYLASGLEPPARLIAPPESASLVEAMESIAESRGIPPAEVLSTLVNEEVKRISRRRKPSE
ncbi:MAG TPA: hypothetical protein VGM37_01210 [Armatimonadota bacterium]|jgi:hypothetical protein